jgi:hypothetical protein
MDTQMTLSSSAVEDYWRDGYLLIPGLFAPAEVEAMLHAIETGGRAARAGGREDAGGRTAKLAFWSELGDDIWAAASTSPRIVNNVRILMGEEIAFFHGKVMLKEAGSGGAWEWHQDYGYWYDQGFVFPRMLSVFCALDAATRENGCLQALRGSHRMGRLNHVNIGAQTGADPERMRELEKRFERIYVEMTPGSVLFFHCNTLHTSAPNESDKHRRSFIMCYNALHNPQLGARRFENRPCPVGLEDDILRHETICVP